MQGLPLSASFAGTGATYLYASIAAGGDQPSYPFWVSAWVKPEKQYAFTTEYVPVALERTTSAGTNGNGACVSLKYRVPRAKASEGTGNSSALANRPVITEPYWSCVTAVFTSTTSRSIYLDGTLVGTDTTAVGPDVSTGTPQIRVGVRGDGTAPFKGQSAYVRYGNGTLSAGDHVTLATLGASVSGVTGILHNYDLISNGNDSIGSLNLSQSGTVSFDSAAPSQPAAFTQANYRTQIFGSTTLPTGTPTVTTGVTSPLSNVTGASSVDQYDWSWTSVATAWRSSAWATRGWLFKASGGSHTQVCFFDDGHGVLSVINDPTAGVGSGGAATISAILAAGVDVYLTLPPGYCAQDPDYPTDHHNDYWTYLNVGTYNPIELWLGHPARVYGYLNGTYTTFHATGLSGGGWQALRLGALGIINGACVPVRGTIAHRRTTNDQYDFEQYIYPNGCLTEDLFALAAKSTRRLWMVHRSDDTCCFGKAPDVTRQYATGTAGQGGGSYLDAVDYDETFLRQYRKNYGRDVLLFEDQGTSFHSLTSWANTNVIVPAVTGAAMAVPGILDKCIGWWPLNEGSGTSAANNISGGATGTYYNSGTGAAPTASTPTWGTSSPFGSNVPTFGGTNTEVRISTSALVTQFPFTMGAWFQTTTTAAPQHVFAMSQSSATGGDNFVSIEIYNGKLTLTIAKTNVYNFNSAGFAASGTLTTNKWYFGVVVFHDLSTRTLYVYDEAGTVLSASGLSDTTGSFALPTLDRVDLGSIYYNGTTGYLQYLSGKMAWAGLWTRSLTPSDVAEVWSLTLGARTAPLGGGVTFASASSGFGLNSYVANPSTATLGVTSARSTQALGVNNAPTFPGTVGFASAAAAPSFNATNALVSSATATIGFAAPAGVISFGVNDTLPGTLSFASASPSVAVGVTGSLRGTLGFASTAAVPGLAAVFGSATGGSLGFSSATATLSLAAAGSLRGSLAFASAASSQAFEATASGATIGTTLSAASGPASFAFGAAFTPQEITASLGFASGAATTRFATTFDTADPALSDCGTDVLERGMSWLTDRLQTTLGQPVIYKRGTSAIAVCATMGSTLLKIQDLDGNIRMERTDKDFIFKASDLVIDAVQVTPERGDIVKQRKNGTLYTYEIGASGGEPPWRWSDSFFTRIRAHAKLVAEEPA